MSKVSVAGIRSRTASRMRYHELTGAGIAGGSLGESEGESEGFDGLLAPPPRRFLASEPPNASSPTVHITLNQAG